MLFEEYSLTPQLFDEETLRRNGVPSVSISHLLYEMKVNGILADLDAEKWHEVVAEKMEGLSENSRNRLKKLMTLLRSRNRIVRHEEISKTPLEKEEDWIETALIEDGMKPYFAILHSGGVDTVGDRVFSLNDFMDSVLWEKRKPNHVFMQTPENLRKHLRDFLSYAQSLEVIDPYFDPTEIRFRESLEIFVSMLAKRRGKRISGRPIDIHTRDKSERNDERFIKDSRKLLKELERKYGHKLTMKVWIDERNAWHDRYLITDQGAVSSSTGLDIRRKSESVWTVIDYSDVGKIYTFFRENSSPMRLKYVL